jgi:ABC-type amino acid transport substrate-binding protein
MRFANFSLWVSEGIPGFSFRDSSGRWRGMDVDFCRALAAATLGSPEKVRFVPLKSSTRSLDPTLPWGSARPL